MLDLYNLLGKFELHVFTLPNGYQFAYPDVEWICQYIFLLFCSYFIIKGFLGIVKMFVK